MQENTKQLNSRMLIIYMIVALLFLAFVDLHIHTHETAATASHGYAVDISSLADNLLPDGAVNEISVSSDSALHMNQSRVDLLVLFLLIAVLVPVLSRTFVARLRESHNLLPTIPFHGTPPLRAPPL